MLIFSQKTCMQCAGGNPHFRFGFEGDNNTIGAKFSIVELYQKIGIYV